jgi:hypothetical protein
MNFIDFGVSPRSKSLVGIQEGSQRTLFDWTRWCYWRTFTDRLVGFSPSAAAVYGHAAQRSGQGDGAKNFMRVRSLLRRSVSDV